MKTCNKGALFVAAVPSSTPGYNFGLSGKQCKQLIKHLRSKPAWIAAFMWVRHPSSYCAPPHAALAMGAWFTFTTHLTAVASEVMAQRVILWPVVSLGCMRLCVR